MKPGLYALASLDGAPLPEDDLRTLGLAGDAPLLRAEGIAVRAVDDHAAAISSLANADSLTVLLGFLDEPEELAATLGLDPGESPAALARATLQRFGCQTSAQMLGEWSLLHWDPHVRELTLVASEARRDVLYFTMKGQSLVAVAPEMLRLARLPWVGRTLDPVVFALSVSRYSLRHIMREETIWQGIRNLQPGTAERFSANGRRTESAPAPPPAELWTGSFNEAVEAVDAVGRHILRQTLARFGSCAAMLSGGLDSSLLTTWAALEHDPGSELFCITSAAPPGSGLTDETEFSSTVARTLGLEQRLVWPRPEWSLFLPSPAALAYNETPILQTREPTYRALYETALAGGAHALLDGVFGEMAVTFGLEMPETRSRPRLLAAKLRDRLVARRTRGGWPERGFQIKLAPALLAELPAYWGAIFREGPPKFGGGPPDAPRDIVGPVRKNALGDTATATGLRHLVPYRDRRLLRLTTRLPNRFGLHQGLTRPVARAMLAGRLPDSVRLRREGKPFAPDYPTRLKEQASQPLGRIALYEEAGVGRWLDLPWLSAALNRLDAVREDDFEILYTIQSTALAAEFLLWVQAGMQPE